MPFFPRLPLFFYLGLLPAICVLWLWADSMSQMTVWTRNRSSNESTLVSARESALVIEHWTVIPSTKEHVGAPPPGYGAWGTTGPWGVFSHFPIQGMRKTPFPALREDSYHITPYRTTEDIATRASSLPFWLIMLCYLPLWLLPVWWLRWRQRKKWAADSHSQEPWPGSKLGCFLRRFPAIFYLGLLPAAGLLGLWSESVINEVKWERTPSWGEGEEITVVDSALHLQQQRITGKIEADTASYGWHGLWEEAGPKWKFRRLPNRLGRSAQSLTRFPAVERVQEFRKEKYVEVALKRVTVPLWLIGLSYLLLWFLLVGWELWRRRKKKRNAAIPSGNRHHE